MKLLYAAAAVALKKSVLEAFSFPLFCHFTWNFLFSLISAGYYVVLGQGCSFLVLQIYHSACFSGSLSSAN